MTNVTIFSFKYLQPINFHFILNYIPLAAAAQPLLLELLIKNIVTNYDELYAAYRIPSTTTPPHLVKYERLQLRYSVATTARGGSTPG